MDRGERRQVLGLAPPCTKGWGEGGGTRYKGTWDEHLKETREESPAAVGCERCPLTTAPHLGLPRALPDAAARQAAATAMHSASLPLAHLGIELSQQERRQLCLQLWPLQDMQQVDSCVGGKQQVWQPRQDV